MRHGVSGEIAPPHPADASSSPRSRRRRRSSSASPRAPRTRPRRRRPRTRTSCSASPATSSRFKGQTGQESSVDQAFLGWGQGQTYGAPFAALFDLLGPIPMLHLGTGGGIANHKEVISPQQIAEGKGDSYLVALNHAIASWGKALYVRPLAEMNNFNAFYGGYNAERDAARRRPHAGRLPAGVPAHLRDPARRHDRPGQRQARGASACRPSRARSSSRTRSRSSASSGARSPISLPQVAGNAAMNYYPGNAYVDVDGRRHLRRELQRALGRPRSAVQRGRQAREAVQRARVGHDRASTTRRS